MNGYSNLMPILELGLCKANNFQTIMGINGVAHESQIKGLAVLICNISIGQHGINGQS